jgi:hypothetical protein
MATSHFSLGKVLDAFKVPADSGGAFRRGDGAAIIGEQRADYAKSNSDFTQCLAFR